MADNHDIVLSLKHVTKLYPGVVALNNVSVDFRAGEIHAIVGENGAGKSTLIKSITGAISFEQGTITIFDHTFRTVDPKMARELGVEAIYQEFNLVESLSAAENICFGKKYGKFVDYKKMNAVAQDLFDQFQIDIRPETPVRELSSAKRQIVEIAKAISKGSKILIMDEPSAPLTVNEIGIMMDIVRKLKESGVTILYISHRLDEIFELADRVSVFRDGKYITTRNVRDTTRQELISLMVGRELTETYPTRKTPPGPVALEVQKLSGNGVKNISFYVRQGEVLGLAGMVGAGRSEIMRVVIGREKKQNGRILVHGQEVDITSTWDAKKYGIGIVTEDRKRDGCILHRSIRENVAIGTVKSISHAGIVDSRQEKQIVDDLIRQLNIRTPSPNQHVLNLSGGNQQKVLIGRLLAAGMDILIFDEPTRGIDVGAKHEIYETMNELCAQGKAIIMISSDMEELLGMSDRIVVLHEKSYVGEIAKDQFSQERVLSMASGFQPEGAC